MKEDIRFTLCLFVGWLLRIANAHPRITQRHDFYELKDALLSRFGEQMAHWDLQHIVKPCWGPGQEGCLKEHCRRCMGTGIYEQKWVRLNRWIVGNNVFHRPVETFYRNPMMAPTIKGYVRHCSVDPLDSGEAQLWLYLIFGRPLFWDALIHGGAFLTPGPRPLLLMQCLAFRARGEWHRWIPQRRCRCGRWIWRPFRGHRSIWFICSRCDSQMRGCVYSFDTPF